MLQVRFMPCQGLSRLCQEGTPEGARQSGEGRRDLLPVPTSSRLALQQQLLVPVVCVLHRPPCTFRVWVPPSKAPPLTRPTPPSLTFVPPALGAITDIEHLFMCLIAIPVFSLRYLLKSSILKNWIAFLLLSYRSPFHIPAVTTSVISRCSLLSF